VASDGKENIVADEPKQVGFHIRVKLPSPAAFHSGPSGDTEYDEAYKGAIFREKPQGFEVRWPRLNEKWPVDSEGYTWVPLYVSHAQDALHNALDMLHTAQRQLETLRKAIKELPYCR
jgi:hypothetical protein